MQKVISTDKAPSAIGPYSQAIEINNMVYTSGVMGSMTRSILTLGSYDKEKESLESWEFLQTFEKILISSTGIFDRLFGYII